VRVTVSVLSAAESEAVFGVAVYDAGVQPVWLHIENHDSVPYLLFPSQVDPNKFSPLEAAYRNHHRFGLATQAAMDTYFLANSIKRLIPPGATVSGFVYTNLHLGAKEVQVLLVGPQRVKRFTFLVHVPGLHTHYTEVNFNTLYQPADIISYNEEELRQAIEALPCCTTNARATAYGDPLNLVFIGELEDILAAFIDRQWTMTEQVYAASIWREVQAFLFGASYRYAPFSPLYLYHRRQDLALQKARTTIAARNHLRLWLAPMRFVDKPIWVGQVSRDIGVRFTLSTWHLTTHRIDPHVDEARGALVEDLLLSRRITKLGFAKGGPAATLATPRANLTGDPYMTDGLRAVLLFADERTHAVGEALLTLQTFDWAWSDDLTLDGAVPWHSPR
jgi:LssY C-terminus